MRKINSRVWAIAAGVTGVALLATGCSSGTAAGSATAASNEKITLTVATLNKFG